jgi:hypothetical protein
MLRHVLALGLKRLDQVPQDGDALLRASDVVGGDGVHAGDIALADPNLLAYSRKPLLLALPEANTSRGIVREPALIETFIQAGCLSSQLRLVDFSRRRSDSIDRPTVPVTRVIIAPAHGASTTDPMEPQVRRA